MSAKISAIYQIDEFDSIERWHIAKMGPAAVPRLAQLLTDGEAHVRAAAAVSLGRMKPDAIRPALVALVKTLDDPDVDVRTQVSHALAASVRGRVGKLRFARAPHDRSASEGIESHRCESTACRFAGLRVDRSQGSPGR